MEKGGLKGGEREIVIQEIGMVPLTLTNANFEEGRDKEKRINMISIDVNKILQVASI